jgi:hypothetical protein
MSKRPIKRTTKAAGTILAALPIPPSHTPTKTTTEKTARATKQARVLAMLRSAAGTTIPAVMKATDWQQHSVRGFLAGVVKKKLKLKIKSEKVGNHRVYRLVESGGAHSNPAGRRARAA